jgi:protein-tyrosine phosphatase
MPEGDKMQGLFDMHCHIIPGVDDGARDMNMSLAILKEEKENGVTDIIITPHFRREMFETDRTVVLERFLAIRKEARSVFPDMRLYIGCEFHSNMDMEQILASDPLYRMIGTKYVLLEFSSVHNKAYIKERTYALLARGYQPIIAHIERYPALARNIDLVEELRDIGAYIQVNADALIGKDGWGYKRFTGKLLREGMIDFVGSDAHNTSDRACHIGKAYTHVVRKIGKNEADRIFIQNPAEIVRAASERS